MKIIHTSDLHIGSPLTARLSPDKAKERKRELIATFSRMVDEAIYQRARLFIIAGDLFDTETVTKTSLDKVLTVIERAASIDFLYLPGNHEKDALISSGAALPKNLRIFGDDWTYFDYDYVTVAGKSEITPNMFGTLNLNYAKTNIVVLHGGIVEGRSGGEYIGLFDTVGKNIDYLALGHYHTYSQTVLEDGGVAVYSGTPEGRGFDEAGEKGFVMIDTNGKSVSHSFIPFATRNMRIIDVDITGASTRIDVENRALLALRTARSGDLVRLRFIGERTPELYPDTDSVVAMHQNSFWHLEAKDETKLRIDPETYKYDKSLKGEFIRLVLSKSDMTDNEKDKVIRAGLAALMGDCDAI
jgi:DNA repair exonuclease SbcCD nuclease subunit